MGKKSKRRGGGGKAAAVADGTADQPLVLVSPDALLQVPTPKSLEGIVSTNDHPTLCLFCSKSVPRGKGFSDFFLTYCCGKLLCQNCSAYFIDIRGDTRCVACNTLSSKEAAIFQSEAKRGKPWAQMLVAGHHFRDGLYNEALGWAMQAALKGHFGAFLMLSDMHREGKGVSRDLHLAVAHARKARKLNADCGLLSNRILSEIANLFVINGAADDAIAVRLALADETDETALDAELCAKVASGLWSNKEHRKSAELYARSFCYGRIASADNAAYQFFSCENYPLSKLWLDVGCRLKSLCFGWTLQSEIRSKLRKIRDACGGCGAPLEGDTRKYCRCCRTNCYCNGHCQKRHWENGHREECKEVEEHMRNVLHAIRLGRFDSIQKML